MERSEILVSIICICVGVSIIYGSYLLHLGKFYNPGSGLFPFLVGCVIVFLSLLHITVQLLKPKGKEEGAASWPDRKGWKQVGKVFFSLIIYTFCLEHLGFLLCTFLIMIFLLRIIAFRGLIFSIITSLAISVCSYLIFEVWLSMGLPKSFAGFF